MKYENSWYVSFAPKVLTLRDAYYLIVVDKTTGIVQYARDSNAMFDTGKFVSSQIEFPPPKKTRRGNSSQA